MVSLTFSRLECGSVQMNPASIRRTLLRPFSFLRQIARSSRDSGSAICHEDGGDRNRSQFLQNERAHCFGMPSVMSTLPIVRETLCYRNLEYSRISQASDAKICWIGLNESSCTDRKDLWEDIYDSMPGKHSPQSAQRTRCTGGAATNSIVVKRSSRLVCKARPSVRLLEFLAVFARWLCANRDRVDSTIFVESWLIQNLKTSKVYFRIFSLYASNYSAANGLLWAWCSSLVTTTTLDLTIACTCMHFWNLVSNSSWQ